MEGAVIGYVPYVQTAPGSSIPTCYEENSFIHLPESEAVPDVQNSVYENEVHCTSSSDTQSEQDSSVELISNLNGEVEQGDSLNCSSNSMHEESEKEHAAEEVTSDVRLVVAEYNPKEDLPIEHRSPQSEDNCQLASPNGSSNFVLEQKPEQTSQYEKTERDDSQDMSVGDLANDNPGLSPSIIDDSICLETDPVVAIAPEITSAPNASSTIADDNRLSPELSQLSQDCSDSSEKRRYLFDFRPNSHEIIVKTKSGEKSFKCYVCGGIYQQKFSLKRHYLRNHIDFRYISDNDISNCNIPVPNYIKKMHSNMDNKKSSNGRKKFKKSSNDIFLDNNNGGLMPGLYRCHDCPNVTCSTESELKDHYDKHPESVKKKFQCHMCSASFFKKQILSRHLASHGKKKVRFECKKCNTGFPSQVELMRHSNSHSSGKMCKYCGKNLSTSANRKRHEALHLGLKPYKCTHCGSCFAQSKDLDRHLRKQHSDLCRECPMCSKLFPTVTSLEVHIRDKHSETSAKKPDFSSSSSNAEKENTSKFHVVSIPSSKPKSCTVCKRAFHTVYAMLKHKRQAHPYHSRKKRKGMKQKMKQSKEGSSNLEFPKSNAKPRKTTYGERSECPPKRGRPIQKTTKEPQKYVRKNNRPGPRTISRREEESFHDFYRNVSDQIHKNLLYYIDGRASQLSLKEYNFTDCQYSSDFFEDRNRLPWSHYNFPQWYDVDNALRTRGLEIKRPEIISSQDEFLYDATGLSPFHRTVNLDAEVGNIPNKSENAQVTNTCERIEGLTVEEMKRFVGKEVMKVILCCVCKDTFNSREDYQQHVINNHPNVDADFIVFEGDKESPPIIPPEMRQMYLSPVGFRFSCDVPPSLNEGALKCTKCKSEFSVCAELHSHLIVCGNLNSSSSHVWKYNVQKRIKNTMKSRMSSAQQQATLNANDYKTPEKMELKLHKAANSTGRASKSAEKLQFYKNGRLQTTSVTVDMNYFKTKPTKPAKNVSKRGRKSYAMVSSMYRNATMQPSTSRECSDCRVVFSSLAALNLHLKSHYSEAPVEEAEVGRIFHSTPNESGNTFLHNISHSLDANQSSNASSFKMDASDLASTSVSSSELSCSQSRTLSPISTVGCSTDTGVKDSTSRRVRNDEGLLNTQAVDSPIDLSTNSCDRNKATLSQKNVPKRSALQIAMDAVLKFYEGGAHQQETGSLHLSKLQETVEKHTGINTSRVSKHAILKKAGRPRKLKGLETSTPLFLRTRDESSGLMRNISYGNSKPISKLEETVERLKSKVSSQEKRQQNLAFTETSVSDKSSEISHNDNLSEVHNQTRSAESTTYLFGQVSDKERSPGVITNSDVNESDSTNSIPIVSNNLKSVSPSDCGVPSISTQSANKLSLKDKTENLGASIASEKTASFDLLNKNISVETQPNQQNIFENKKDIQDLSAVTNSEFPVPERLDKVNQGSQGRSSPTFDSILKVINQKLHSEEDESSHPDDDAAITWLEDEQFEIHPSRSNQNIIGSANSDLLLSDGKSTVSPDLNVSNSDVGIRPDVLLVNSEISSCEKIATLPSNSSNLNNGLLQKTSLAENIIKTVKSTVGGSGTQTSPKDQVRFPNGIPKIPEATASVACLKSQGTLDSKSLEKSSNPPKIKKEVMNSSESRLPARRGPGRPRKKLLENIDLVIRSNTKKENASSSDSITISCEPIDNSINQNDAPLNGDDLTNEVVPSVPSSRKDAYLPPDTSLQNSPRNNEEHALRLANSTEVDNLGSNQMELPSFSLRTFRTKAKQAQCDSISKPNFTLKSNTTEFGKSLASKMKEKMRLSFEQDSSKTTTKTDELTPSPSTLIPDAISQPKEKLMKAVKKECDAAEPTKIHSCPYCMLEFAYLTNFRRHLKACLARNESKEADSVPGNSTTNLQHLPKKDEVDYSMLNLYRHQSRQTQMLKEFEKNLGSDTPIKKYECAVCHRIYLNLFTFLQHKITQHNLAPQSSSESNVPNDSHSCPSELNDGSNTFATGSASDSTQQGNDLDESVNYESLMDNPISAQSNDSSVDEPTELVPSVTKEAENKIYEVTNESQCSIPEVKNFGNKIKLTEVDFTEESNESESVKDEKQTVKRKRGRPFGWRKNINADGGNKKSAQLRKGVNASKKSGVVQTKRAGKHDFADTNDVISPKLKAKMKAVTSNKVEKAVSRNKSVTVDEILRLENNSVKGSQEIKTEKSDTSSSQISGHTIQSVLKDFPKSSLEEDSDNDFVDLKMKQYTPKESSRTKNSPSVDMDSKRKSLKRGRGRPPVSPDGVLKLPDVEPDTPRLKRRPGRPPKNLQIIAGPSQPSKSVAASLSIRSSRKTARTPDIDSSDSECEIVKSHIPLKKKCHKICALCKKKFLSSLALQRHTQIVHSRRMQQTVDKSATATKAPKKMSPKSPVIDPPESDPAASQSDDLTPKKSPTPKVCPICKEKFDSNELRRHHLQTAHSRKSEPDAVKIPESSDSASSRPISVKNKQVETPNRNSLTRQSKSELDAMKIPAESFQSAGSRPITVKNKQVETSYRNSLTRQSKSELDAMKILTESSDSSSSRPTIVKNKQVETNNRNSVTRQSKSELDAVKIPPESSDSAGSRPISVKNKQVETPNRNSLTRQCRKSLPRQQKRIKKQLPEQVKKQKL